TPQRATAVLARAASFPRLAPEAQARELAPLYLVFEHYLTEADSRPVNRMDLRRAVRRGFAELLAIDSFRLILEDEARQEILLCRAMLLRVVGRASEVLGASGGQGIGSIREW